MLALSSNQILGTVNAGNAGPLNLPTCSTGALSWTPGTGFGCNALNGLVSPITQNLVFTGQHAVNLNATCSADEADRHSDPACQRGYRSLARGKRCVLCDCVFHGRSIRRDERFSHHAAKPR